MRPIRGRTDPPRQANGSRTTAPREEWITIAVPPIVDTGLFETVQGQLDENRRRKRDGRRRPGWLLQGLVVCRQCGYAFYGKMARSRVGERQPADYGYYRCTGTDAHKFGGQTLCSNRSVRSDKLEPLVWRQIEMVLEDPQRVSAEYERRIAAGREGRPREDVDALERQIARLRRGIDRLIDSYAEELIEINEFKPRLAGLKQRMARLEAERDTATVEHEAERTLQMVIGRLTEFADRIHAGMDQLDWEGRRDIIRALVRRIEIDCGDVEVVFKIPGASAPPLPPGSARPEPDSKSSGAPLIVPPVDGRQHCGRSYLQAGRRDPARTE